MDSMTLFVASLAVSCIGALASILLIKADNAAKTAGCLIGAVAAVLSFVAGIQAVLGDVTSVDTIVFFPFAHFQLLLNQLSGLFVALISVLAFAGSIYGLNYFDEYPGKKGRAGFFFNTFVASMMLVITADNVFWFLVAFELMSLTSYFLVVIEENENSIHGGWLYFVIAHVGFVLIMASFLTMTNFAGGSFAFADFRATQFSPAVASVCFVLAFFGFGAKAGIIPLHGWLPKAHPEAPSNVSALMSGGMIKIGIFGILKVGLDLLSASGVQVWWGLMVMVFGAISSVLGVAFALLLEGTGSIFYGMFAHFLINGFSVIITALSDKILPLTGEESIAAVAESMTTETLVNTFCVYAVVAAVSTCLAGAVYIWIVKHSGRTAYLEKNWKGSGEKKVSPVFLIGVVLCLGFMVWRDFWA